jgi:glycosyltransferase involved in cell wall biosynthesis
MMPTLPKVTVLLSTYNRPDYLREAIRSVVNQSLIDWELLVMNDGGVDVREGVRAFQDGRIRYFHDPVNRGLAVRLNFGLREAHGEYIAYLGDDDLYYPNHLEVLSKALDENPGMGAVYSDLYAVQFIKDGSSGRRYPLNKFIQVSRDYNRDFMFFFNHTLHVSLMHRRDLALRAGGYDESVTVLIDWNMTRKLSFYTDFKYIPVVTGEYYMPLGKSDRISVLERQDNEKYRQNLRKIRADLPPEPWPKVDRIAAILIVKEWEASTVERITNLIDRTLYPVKFILINNDIRKKTSACKEILGKIGELKNLYIYTPPREWKRLKAYRWGAQRFDEEYIYLPTPEGSTYGLIAARHFLNERGGEGVRWPSGEKEENSFEILMKKDLFLQRTNPQDGEMEMSLSTMANPIPESLWCDFYSYHAMREHHQGNFQLAYELFQKAESRPKGGIGDQYLIDIYSKICFDLEQYDQAEGRCRLLIERGYGADNWIRLGKILQKKRRWREAIDAFQKGLSQIGLQEKDLDSPVFPITVPEDFGSFTALIGLGECLIDVDDLPEAARMFRRAAKLKANSPKPFLGFGKLFLKSGELDRAEEALKEAVEKNGKDSEPYGLLGALYQKKDQLPMAFSSFLKAFKLNQKAVENLDSLYEIGIVLGRWEEMKEVLEGLIKEKPEDPRIKMRLTSIYGGMKKEGGELHESDIGN